MPQDADLSQPPPRARPRLAIDFNQDRSAAFRRARRHSFLVRTLKLVLPLAAIGLFTSYGAFVQRSFKRSAAETSKFTVDRIGMSTEALVAHTPQYEGFDKKGGRFQVRAKTAKQAIGQRGPVLLNAIDGTLTDASNAVTVLKATSGTYDTTTNILQLHQKIDVSSQNGMHATLTRATVHTRKGLITSDQPVLITLPGGTVRGKTLRIEQKERRATLAGGVVAHLKRDRKTSPLAATGADGAAGLAGRSDAPVDIASATLVLDDSAKLATFAGKVVAAQDGSTLETEVLAVSYEGSAVDPTTTGEPAGQSHARPAVQAAGKPDQRPAGPSPASGRVKHMIARTPLILTRGTDRVTGSSGTFDVETDRATLFGPVVLRSGRDRMASGNRADLDNKRETMLLTGNVVVVQDRNVLKGTRLYIERKTGRMSMMSPARQDAHPDLARGRIAARLYQAAGAAGPKPARKAAPAVADNPLLKGFKSDQSQPIDIDAERLDVDDRAKSAIFRGRVEARQGDYVMRTEQLVAVYSGDTGLLPGSPQTRRAQPANGAKRSAQLRKVRAPRPVKVTATDGRTARGDSAEFDLARNTIVLVGDVVLTQHKSVTTGSRALIDLKTGTMQLLENPSAAADNHKGARKQRVRALLYPQQFQDAKQAARGKRNLDNKPPARLPTTGGTGAIEAGGWSATVPPRINGRNQ